MGKILVVGATSDIATALCHKFAYKKNELIITGRNIENLNKLQNELQNKYSVSVESVLMNVEEHEDMNVFLEKIKKTDYDGVVLAYGYLGDQEKGQKDDLERSRILNINFNTAVDIIEVCAKYLEDKKSGFICAISSVAGDRGRQSNYLYGSAKGALSVYLQGLRNRLNKSNVHVITVKPGFVKTKMTEGKLKEGKMVATPEKVANDIYKGIVKKKNTIYTPSFWKYIMLVIKSVPEPIFKKLNL